MFRSLAIALGLTGSLLAGVPMVTPVHAQGRSASVEVDPVRIEALTATVAVLGRLVSRQSGVVAARIAESVQSLEVEVGDRVIRGDVLARLSPDRVISERERWSAEVKVARALIASARADLAKARQALDRQNRLKGSTAYRQDRSEDAQRDVEAAEARLAGAGGALARATAQLALAETAVNDATVIAPYDGVVTVRHTATGSYLRVGDPVVTMLNDTEMEIEADVPANRAAGLKPGTVVEGELPDGSQLFAVVRAVIPEENTRTHTRAVRLVPQISVADADLAVNHAVMIRVPVGVSRDVVTIHKDAVTVLRGQDMVFVVEDGKAVPRPVVLGESVGPRFEVRSGVTDGELAVVRGNERLRPGQPVDVQPGSS